MRRGKLKDFVLEVLLGKPTVERGILNPSFTKQIIEEHINGIQNHDRLIWGIMTLELWIAA